MRQIRVSDGTDFRAGGMVSYFWASTEPVRSKLHHAGDDIPELLAPGRTG